MSYKRKRESNAGERHEKSPKETEVHGEKMYWENRRRFVFCFS